jgi:DNA-binding transcriptional MerR regulator
MRIAGKRRPYNRCIDVPCRKPRPYNDCMDVSGRPAPSIQILYGRERVTRPVHTRFVWTFLASKPRPYNKAHPSRSRLGSSMIRKRDRYTRLRAKRTRPKTPAPETGWVIAELARIAQVPVRRLRHYVQLGLIQPSEFRGTATRYQRRELLRVLGIQRMRAEQASMVKIKQTLQTLSDHELEAWLRTGPLSNEAAAALGPASQVASGISLALAESGRAGAGAANAGFGVDSSTWQRVCLLPGLELMIAANASPAVIRAAQSICDEYLARPSSSAEDR